ncbi:MAG: hypothetical protein NVS4B5_10090 [Vulcanimicrobiaceae bacterium]
MRIRTGKDGARHAEAFLVQVVRDAVPRRRMREAVARAERLQVAVVVHVALVDLQDVMIDVHDGERNADAIDPELLELQRAHDARRVFDQRLIAGDARGAVGIAFDEMRVENLSREMSGHELPR